MVQGVPNNTIFIRDPPVTEVMLESNRGSCSPDSVLCKSEEGIHLDLNTLLNQNNGGKKVPSSSSFSPPSDKPSGTKPSSGPGRFPDFRRINSFQPRNHHGSSLTDYRSSSISHYILEPNPSLFTPRTLLSSPSLLRVREGRRVVLQGSKPSA
ncbi:hypothetical protein RRG08_066216 [Elysia crispata]|uniref:Uncharacterized protein n=1 Tax=Elysia crispata TaxID=231223 RepID=A0AAE1BDN0_9GAST|nr:hypothetical protein RRG08_066216 [Elysia crispata]